MTNPERNWLGGSGRLLEEVSFQKDRSRRMGGLDMDGRRETRPGGEEDALCSRISENAGAVGREGLMSWVGPGAWWGAGDKAKGEAWSQHAFLTFSSCRESPDPGWAASFQKERGRTWGHRTRQEPAPFKSQEAGARTGCPRLGCKEKS